MLDDYDVVLIDCQPSLGLLTVNALRRADGVIIPLECEYFALRGVALLIQTIDKVASGLTLNLKSMAFSPPCTTAARCTAARSCAVVQAFGDKVFHTVINRTVRFPDTPSRASRSRTSRRPPRGERVPRPGQGGACPVAAGGERGPARGGKPCRESGAPALSGARPGSRAPGARPAAGVRHDEKMTVYVTADELLEIEHARLMLRRDGLAVDRGRLVREAIAVVLADLEPTATTAWSCSG